MTKNPKILFLLVRSLRRVRSPQRMILQRTHEPALRAHRREQRRAGRKCAASRNSFYPLHPRAHLPHRDHRCVAPTILSYQPCASALASAPPRLTARGAPPDKGPLTGHVRCHPQPSASSLIISRLCTCTSKGQQAGTLCRRRRRQRRHHLRPTLLCSASPTRQKQRRWKGLLARRLSHHAHRSRPCQTGGRRCFRHQIRICRCFRHQTRYFCTRNRPAPATSLLAPGSVAAHR